MMAKSMKTTMISALIMMMMGVAAFLPGAVASDPTYCTIEEDPCPSETGKIQICQYDPYLETYRTSCIYPHDWENHLYDSKNHCGACAVDDTPKLECSAASTPCGGDPSKIEICAYSARADQYSTQCVTQGEFDTKYASVDEAYCGPCTKKDLNRCVDSTLIYYEDFEYYQNTFDVV